VIPPMAELEATARAIALSTFIDVPVLIVHVSQPAVAAHIHKAQMKGLPIYAETYPQYLFLTRGDLDRLALKAQNVSAVRLHEVPQTTKASGRE
jgi:dihydroorotase-like cyclic amidohydrolase